MDLVQWRRRRRNTICTYLYFAFLFGTDITVVYMTLIPYLEEILKSRNTQFYYSMAITLNAIISAITAVLIGRFVDRTRYVKCSMYVTLVCCVLANILYILSYSPYTVVVARAVCGLILAEQYVLRGEIIRCYDEEAASRILWWFTAAGCIGCMIGSWVPLTFVNVNFSVGSLKINKHNFGGIFLAGVLLINVVLVYYFAHDCSKEYDLKSILNEEKLRHAKGTAVGGFVNEIAEEGEIISSQDDDKVEVTTTAVIAANENSIDSTDQVNQIATSGSEDHIQDLSLNSSPKKALLVLKGFARNSEIVLMMVSTLVFAGVGFTTDMLFPIVVLNIFRWSEKALSIASTAQFVVKFLNLLLMSKYCVTGARIYYVTIISVVVTILNLTIFLIITSVQLTMHWQITTVTIFTIVYPFIWYLDCVTLPCMLGRMVNADIQSFTESIRSNVACFTSILSGVMFVVGVQFKYWLGALLGSSLILFVVLLARRKHLIDIKLIVFG